MAKKNTEKKFRVVRLALSNDAFYNLEAYAKSLKISKSRVIAELLEYADCPLALMEIISTNAQRRALRQSGQDALDIRRGKGIEIEKKSAMLMSLDAKLDAFYYQKTVYEKLRDALADMPDGEAVIYGRKQNLARLKGLDANIEMAQVLRQEEIENLKFS